MRKRMLRLSASLFAVGMAASPAAAFNSGCPDSIIVGGQYACHLVSGTNCELCRYNCEGSQTWFNMCVDDE